MIKSNWKEQKLTLQDCLFGLLFLLVYELITWTLVAAVILALLYAVSLIYQYLSITLTSSMRTKRSQKPALSSSYKKHHKGLDPVQAAKSLLRGHD